VITCELIVHLLVIVQNNFSRCFHNLNFINIFNFYALVFHTKKLAVYLRESSIMLTLNNELEGTWKEAVVVKFEVMLWHMPEGPEENQIKVTNVPAETRIVFYRKKIRAPQLY